MWNLDKQCNLKRYHTIVASHINSKIFTIPLNSKINNNIDNQMKKYNELPWNLLISIRCWFSIQHKSSIKIIYLYY